MEEISELLLNQRIRNRIIEVLEVYASVDDQKFFGTGEVVNMWEDWVDDKRLPGYREPIFSKQEQLAISAFHSAWKRVCEDAPLKLPSVEELLKNPQWLQLMNDARETLSILSKRGLLSEEQEIT